MCPEQLLRSHPGREVVSQGTEGCPLPGHSEWASACVGGEVCHVVLGLRGSSC